MIPQLGIRSIVVISVVLLCIGDAIPSIHAQPAATIYSNPYRVQRVNIPSPYWGYTYNPYGDYLHGAADVIRSQGQFLINKQQASLLREKATQEKFVTRRKEVELWAWERDFKNEAWKKERERMRQDEIERDRTDPPLALIVGATSLNLLLAELKKCELSPGQSVRVNPEWLRHIHVTYASSGTGGNVGLLKGAHVAWPLFLRREKFNTEREQIEKLLAQAKEEALKGAVQAETLISTRRQVDDLEKRVLDERRSNVDDLWSPSDLIQATRALREFRSALQMLEREDAKYYLRPLQGETIADLVQYMNTNGLSFAPATTGGERAYQGLHRAIAKEYSQVKNKY